MQQYYATKKENNIMHLNKDDFNHIKNVMRMKEKDSIIVAFDGISYICSLNKDLISAEVISEFKVEDNNLDLLVYVPLLQEEKMKFILQHGTELGVSEFIVVMYNHCKYKLKKSDYDKKLVRWNKILKEASEQCYRINKPKVSSIIEVKDVKASESVNILCSLDKDGVKSIKSVLTSKNCNDTISVAFGPEGGLDVKEESLLESIGFIKTSLGERVLRSETVILYIASIINYLKESD